MNILGDSDTNFVTSWYISKNGFCIKLCLTILDDSYGKKIEQEGPSNWQQNIKVLKQEQPTKQIMSKRCVNSKGNKRQTAGYLQKLKGNWMKNQSKGGMKSQRACCKSFGREALVDPTKKKEDYTVDGKNMFLEMLFVKPV
jgi:hypothetical protein